MADHVAALKWASHSTSLVDSPDANLKAAYLELTAKLEALETDFDYLAEDRSILVDLRLRATTAENALAKCFADTVERCEREIPTSWLDPLLSGPDSVIKETITCPQIELLLTQLRKRIRALTPETAAPHPHPDTVPQDNSIPRGEDISASEYGYGQFMNNAFGRTVPPAAASGAEIETPIKWDNVSIRVDKWKRLQALCEELEPHQHYDGQNECQVCDEPLTDALIRQCETLLTVRRDLSRLRTACLALADEMECTGREGDAKRLREIAK